MRIGIVGLWAERGAAYVNHTIRTVLARKHDLFIFARTGGVYGQPLHPLESGQWAVPNLTKYSAYDIRPEHLTQWITQNKLDVVVFNEEYDFRLVFTAKRQCRVVTYLDYLRPDWLPLMRHYDLVLCSTHRSLASVKDHCNAVYIGWGVDTDVFKPAEKPAQFDFVHNAGYLGIGYRKSTPSVVMAFKRLAQDHPEASLLVHAQTPLSRLPPRTRDAVRHSQQICWLNDTAEAPGLYHHGRVLVQPSKLEGLGIPIYEGLSCGLPVITTDAPPMNEPISADNGWLVKPATSTQRADGISFPETPPSISALEERMRQALSADIPKMSRHARDTALLHHSLDALANRLIPAFEDIPHHVGPIVSTIQQPAPVRVRAGKLAYVNGIAHMQNGERSERLRVHLVSARWSNYPWGAGNEVHRALEAMGAEILDSDFRIDYEWMDEALQQDAHLTLVLKGNGIPASAIRKCPGRTVLWYPDDLRETDHGVPNIRANGSAFDAVYSFSRDDLPLYEALCGVEAQWLPLACDPDLHRPLGSVRDIDVLHIGALYSNRRALLDRLAPKFNIHHVEGVYGEDYVRMLNRAKIVLNIGLGSGGIQHRVFEALGCGAFLLTSECEEARELFIGQKHLVYFQDAAECEAQIAHYLKNAAQREAIAAAGHREAYRYHTTRHRIEAMLEG